MDERRHNSSAIRLSLAVGLVPANILRLHVAFPEPPDAELAASSARLLDAAGEEIPHAFLDLPGGLWSTDGRMLTLILHPGRIKSGLVGSGGGGPLITEGRTYSVEIDGGAGAIRLPLRVGPPVVTAIDPSSWLIGALEEGGLAPLTVEFDRVMDSESVKAALMVLDETGERVCGIWQITDDGTDASFIPEKPWSSTRIQLQPATDLEDVAGNRPYTPFEQTGTQERQQPANVG
jgi:hypothetical protein